MTASEEASHAELRLGDRFGWIVALGFFILAGWFFLADPIIDDPLTEPVLVKASVIPPVQWRNPTPDPPIIEIAGMNMKCSACHTLFISETLAPRMLAQHTELALSHGGNDWCFSCHDLKDRNRLALTGDNTVGFDQVPQLCGKCHGPVYRDWQVGIHGKTVGYWNIEMGKQVRMTCTQCHDPHAPAYAQMKLLPGPNTLRMGDGDVNIDRHDHKRNPLRQWQEITNQDGQTH